MSEEEPIEILCSCNREYQQLLAATLYSLSRHASPQRELRFRLIHLDLDPRIRKLIDGYLEADTIEVRWIDGNPEHLDSLIDVPDGFFDLPGKGHYDRLLAPALIAGPRALYLDRDLWVQSDLFELWQQDIGNQMLAAVHDQGIPSLSSDCGVVDWERRGLDPDAEYFNSGVMPLPLERWRSDNLAQLAVDLALDNVDAKGESPPLHDQYALNVRRPNVNELDFRIRGIAFALLSKCANYQFVSGF